MNLSEAVNTNLKFLLEVKDRLFPYIGEVEAIHDSEEDASGEHYLQFGSYDLIPVYAEKKSIKGNVQVVHWILVANYYLPGSYENPPDWADKEIGTFRTIDKAILEIAKSETETALSDIRLGLEYANDN